MGKKKFNKKQSVRYALVPGKDDNGNPLNLFQPIEGNSRLSEAQKKEVVRGLEDYEIEIDGKQVSQSEIPSYILEQIRGRADLVFNQKHPEMMMVEEYEEEGEEFMEGEEDWDEEEWEEDE